MNFSPDNFISVPNISSLLFSVSSVSSSIRFFVFLTWGECFVFQEKWPQQ